MKYMIQTIDLTKRFGDFTANDHINLSVKPQENKMYCWGKWCRQEYFNEYVLWFVGTNRRKNTDS